MECYKPAKSNFGEQMKTKIKPFNYLALGIVTISAAHTTVTIDLAGWIACVPFLLYLRQTNGIKSRLLFLLGLIVAWSICILKIVSPPMPFGMVFLYSVPISLFHLPGYLLWDKFKDRSWATLLFPSVMIVMEWIQYNFTPLASWGVAAYTQSHNLMLMQTVSLFGMPGLSFLVYWVNISISEIIFSKRTTFINLHIPFVVIVLLIVFGSLRYEWNKASGVKTLKVAAVGTDSEVSRYPLPSKESNDRVKRNLFRRTTVAANSGAKLIVWNEASTFIMPEEENAWKDSLSALTERLKVSLVAAFIVPLSESPIQYKNNYLFFDSTGTLLYTYNKHQPVPGEPTIKGTEPLKVFDVAGSKTGAIICYDYDFPYLAKGFGALNADIVADPSSDWRGIDPLHTRMAAFRAVEQGHSILRSTRFGMSAAITPYGEFSSQMSSYDGNDKLMMANLPLKGVMTLYSVIGDSFVYLSICFIVLFLILHKRSVKTKITTL
jgi:apolipoprotein N-acyltransferase